jgi:hypothetical protein
LRTAVFRAGDSDVPDPADIDKKSQDPSFQILIRRIDAYHRVSLDIVMDQNRVGDGDEIALRQRPPAPGRELRAKRGRGRQQQILRHAESVQDSGQFLAAPGFQADFREPLAEDRSGPDRAGVRLFHRQ